MRPNIHNLRHIFAQFFLRYDEISERKEDEQQHLNVNNNNNNNSYNNNNYNNNNEYSTTEITDGYVNVYLNSSLNSAASNDNYFNNNNNNDNNNNNNNNSHSNYHHSRNKSGNHLDSGKIDTSDDIYGDENIEKIVSGKIPTGRLARKSSGGVFNSSLWVDDETVSSCSDCHLPFTFWRRRHHCRRYEACLCVCVCVCV